ncbi:hypothetical protein ACFX15_028866 [Malus domestica]
MMFSIQRALLRPVNPLFRCTKALKTHMMISHSVVIVVMAVLLLGHTRYRVQKPLMSNLVRLSLHRMHREDSDYTEEGRKKINSQLLLMMALSHKNCLMRFCSVRMRTTSLSLVFTINMSKLMQVGSCSATSNRKFLKQHAQRQSIRTGK